MTSVVKRGVSSSKHLIEFIVVFIVGGFFILGLFFANPQDNSGADFPPPPVWSRGILQSIKFGNDSTTESFDLLRRIGFSPSGILDVGAYKGMWARMAERSFPDAEMFLIEASEDRRQDLMKTGMSYVIAMVGSKYETVDFYDIPGKRANSRFREQTEDFLSDIPVKKVTYPLDVLMEGMPAVQLMKIDVQGGELEVLKGGKNILKEVEVIYISVPMMKIHKGSPLALEILSYCKSIGFELLNYVDGDARGQNDALVHIELTLAKKESPLFSRITEGVMLQEDILQQQSVEEDLEDRGA